MISCRIAFVTSKKLLHLADDDRLAVPELAARGVEVVPAVWNDPSVDWRGFAAVVIRSPWDYLEHFPEFLRWIAQLELMGARVLNPASVLMWNASKNYLRELEDRGVTVVPTHWMPARDSSAMLEELGGVLAREGWGDFVVKPAVSAGAKRTHRFSARPTAAERAELETALADFDPGSMVMLQPYLPEVASEGEWSLVFFGGADPARSLAFSHAALKRPAPTDYRVQTELGGSVEGASPPNGAIEWATSVVRAAEALLGEGLLYARVDLIRSQGRFLLGELELLEPSLYLAQGVGAPARFAEAVRKMGVGDRGGG